MGCNKQDVRTGLEISTKCMLSPVLSLIVISLCIFTADSKAIGRVEIVKSGLRKSAFDTLYGTIYGSNMFFCISTADFSFLNADEMEHTAPV